MALTKVKGSGLATGAATASLVGIDDNATSTAITIDASENLTLAAGGTTYGKIGSSAGTYIASVACGLRLHAGGTKIFPTDANGGALPNAVDLGAGGGEWKDLYLSGNVKMASGKGIDFSAVSDGSRSVSSNLLDDYEEGTWTPTWSDGTNADATYTIRNGFYTKIGNKVSVYCDIAITSLGTISGILRLTGLPFPTGNQASCTVGFTSSLNTTAGHSITGRTSSGNTYILMNIWDTAAGLTGLLDTELSSNGRLMVSMEYFA